MFHSENNYVIHYNCDHIKRIIYIILHDEKSRKTYYMLQIIAQCYLHVMNHTHIPNNNPNKIIGIIAR